MEQEAPSHAYLLLGDLIRESPDLFLEGTLRGQHLRELPLGLLSLLQYVYTMQLSTSSRGQLRG